MTTRPTAPQSSSTPLQLSLVAAVPPSTDAPATADTRAWQIGLDHARYGLALPMAHLHTGSPLYAGWCAGQARRGRAQHRDPAPGLRSWLQLRLQAWCEGLDYDDALLTPNYLRQLEAPHCSEPGLGRSWSLSGLSGALLYLLGLVGEVFVLTSVYLVMPVGRRSLQHALLKPITKGTWLVERHADVIATIYEAVRVATSGEPGPVFVEIPVHLQLLTGDEGPAVAAPVREVAPVRCALQEVSAAAELLRNARSPTIFVGWGAVDATHEVALLAERLGAPVSTTLQGVSAFPANHPLHAGFCLGRAPRHA